MVTSMVQDNKCDQRLIISLCKDANANLMTSETHSANCTYCHFIKMKVCNG